MAFSHCESVNLLWKSTFFCFLLLFFLLCFAYVLLFLLFFFFFFSFFLFFFAKCRSHAGKNGHVIISVLWPTLVLVRLYNPKNQGSYNYDNCGLLDPDTGEGYLPRERYANYSEFIEAIKPPYFEKVKWLVIDDSASSYPPCFSASTTMQMGIMTLIIVSLAHLFH